jgi:hypothetical protein
LRANTRYCDNYLTSLLVSTLNAYPRCHPVEEIAILHNALDPDLMTAAERLAEVGEILAAGLLRLRAREREAGNRRDVSLDFPATQSVHAKNRNGIKKACRAVC